MHRFCLTLLAALGLACVNSEIGAQVYPSRQITIIAPFPAGGSIDLVARVLGERMRSSLGQPIVVENVTGASGSIGTGRVARAAADGYTLGIGNLPTHVINGAALSLNYNVQKDFEPVALLTTQQLLILTKQAVPAKDLKELIAWLQANPGKASQGTSGPGSIIHLAGALFQRETGTHFEFVPYRGNVVQELVAGHVDLTFDLAANSLPQVRAGKVKAYAVTARSRLAAAPDIPTVDEAGLPGFHISTWFALFAPKGTPKAIVARLHAAVVEVLADPAVRKRFADFGQEIPPREQQTQQALAAFHIAEIEKWWPIIKAAGVKPE
jgi:tripartite-type tricarboxylate transporter receptor subunit TctC